MKLFVQGWIFVLGGAWSAVALASTPSAGLDNEAFTLSPAALLEAAASVPEDKRSDVAILWANVRYTIDEQGSATIRRTLVYRMPRAADDGFEEWDVVAVPWAPWHQDRPVIRARVVSPTGEVRELDPATLSERPVERWSDDVFSDARVLEAPIPGLVDGVVVETVTETHDRSPLFAAGVVYRERLLAGAYVQTGRITVEAPAASPLHWKVSGSGEVRVTDTTAGDVRSLVFDYAALSRPETYQWSVPTDQLPDPDVTFSTASDWSAVATAYARIVEEKVRAPGLGSWLGPAPKGGRQAVIDHALRRLYRDVRYTGLEFGSQSIVPFGPEETLRRGFGDCKDQASLLVAALRHYGVPAHVALLRTGRDRDSSPDLPGLGLFDHAIVYVPGEPAFWIDPTFKFSGPGEVPTGDEGRLALIAANSTRELAPVVSAPSAPRRIVKTREFWLAPFGKSRLRETTEYFGAEAVEARLRHETLSNNEMREGLETYIENIQLKAKLDRFEVTPAADLTKPYRLVLEISDSGRAVADANEAAFALMASDLLSHVPWGLQGGGEEDEAESDEEARTLPFVVDEPLEAVTRYVVHVPPGLEPREQSSEETSGAGPIRLSTSMKVVAADRVEAEARLVIERATLDPQQYEDTRKAIAELQEKPPELVYFDQAVTKTVLAGDIRRALELARALVAREPKSWFRHAQLGEALLAAGLGQDACVEAERATQLEPKVVDAHATLGWCLQHDAIGRRFGPGFRRAEAIAAYHQALALDAEDFNASFNLAVLLEHDEQGRRKSTGDDLDEAVDIYRRLNKKGDHPLLRPTLILTLLRSGRADEALEILSRQDHDSISRQLRITSLAVAKGGAAAAAEARRWLTDAAQRSAVLRGSAMDLMNLRRYEAASIVARAAVAETPQAAELLRWADTLARAATTELTHASPQAFVGELTMAAAAGTAETIPPLMAEEVVALIGDRSKEFIADAALGRATVAKVSAANMDADALTEMAVRSAQYELDGSDDLGYRVSMTAAIGEQREKVRFYLVPSKGGWSAAYSRRPTGALGAMALTTLEKGDLVAARRWLDWAFDADEANILANVVQRLWTKGGAAGSEEIRRTALALIVEAGAVTPHPEALRALRDAEAGSAVRFALDLALARGAFHRRDGADLLVAAEDLLGQGGTGAEILGFKMAALDRLARWEELEQLAKQEYALEPVAALAKRAESLAAFGSGRIAEGMAIVERRETEGVATANELNSAAWGALYLPTVDPRALRWAQRSAEMTGFNDPWILHTLAAVHAWAGASREGYQILLQSLAAAGQASPSESTWLVMGRLSETYGLPEVAADLYRRAAADPRDPKSPTSVAALARLQLGKLGPPRRPR